MSRLDYQRLAGLLRLQRGQENLSLRAVAEQTGISASTLSRVENGHGDKLSLDNFLALCEWLEVPPGNLIYVYETPAAEKRDDPALWLILAGSQNPQVVCQSLGTLELVSKQARDYARKHGAVIWAAKVEYLSGVLAWPRPETEAQDAEHS